MVTKCTNDGARLPLDLIKQAIAADEYYIECPYCHTLIEFRKREATLVERGYDHLLLGEFNKARECFEMQIARGEASSSVYLGHALADFNVRVEFDEDYKARNIYERPHITCSRFNDSLFANNPSYLNARRAADREFEATPALKQKELDWLEYYANTVDSFDRYYTQINDEKHGESYDLFVAYDDEPLEKSEERRSRKARRYYEDANKIYNQSLGEIENAFIANPAEHEENRLFYDAEVLYAIEHSKCMLVVIEGDIIGFRLRNIYTRFYGADDLKDRNLGFVCLNENHPMIRLPDSRNADHDHVFELESDGFEFESARMTEFVLENIGRTVRRHSYHFSVKSLDGEPFEGVTVCGFLNNQEVFSKKTNSRGEARISLIPNEYEIRVVDAPEGYVARRVVTDLAGSPKVVILERESRSVGLPVDHPYEFIDKTHVRFGDYPQKREEARDVLNFFEDFGLPTRRDYHGWQVLFINKKGQPTWYRDEEIKGKKYRAVYFDGFRDLYSVQDSDISPSSQTEHHYARKELYCFSFEPLVWVVEKKGARQLTLVSESGIDAREFSNDEDMSNEWTDCSLRQWLNHDFMETAFDDQAQNVLCSFVGDEEEDKVYLLDKDDDRDFYKQDVVAVRGTDYYQCIGGWGEDSKVEKFWINNHNKKEEDAEANVVTPRYTSNVITDYVDSTGVAVLPKVIVMRYDDDDKEE